MVDLRPTAKGRNFEEMTSFGRKKSQFGIPALFSV